MPAEAYTLKTISLTGTPHNLEFFRKILECFRDFDFLLTKNKADLSNKENSPLWPIQLDVLYSCPTLFYFLKLITEFKPIMFFWFQKGNHIHSCIENPVEHLR